ncbi:MAG: carbon-nitrogen hydrolase family protein [Pseudomonadota bacterium]
MRAAIYQSDGATLSPAQRVEKLSAELHQRDVDLLVCPELFLSGYNAGDDIAAYAETHDGPMAHQIAQLARDTSTAIVYGFPERDEDQIFNAANCFSARGDFVATHRKLVLPPGFEGDFFATGEGLTLFDLDGVRCGVLICYDVEFPESVRALAAAGAQLVIVPTALGVDWPHVANKLVPTRAFENGVWLMYANHAGEENGLEYLGHSCIAAPDGSDAARADSLETVIEANVFVRAVKNAQDRLPYISTSGALSSRLASGAN